MAENRWKKWQKIMTTMIMAVMTTVLTTRKEETKGRRDWKVEVEG